MESLGKIRTEMDVIGIMTYTSEMTIIFTMMQIRGAFTTAKNTKKMDLQHFRLVVYAEEAFG